MAVIGAFSSAQAKTVYSGFTLPSWAPPPWLFGPVWTVLYLMIAVSGWLFWRAKNDGRGLGWYGAGLLLNAAWTPLFFTAGAYTAALIDIIALDLVIVLTVVLFRRRSALAAALQLPYLAWTLFATALNAAVVVLN
ncbi:TspO and MBR like protein [Amycolatopsis decaplanina DSM 44594]|uniref:TspO and MBR like protein n=1 Tax=Amycolatopsis decaplanina DSM 44594 TaxID=1284240 RepID=M2WW26_9PSEU|nr:TspO and MBR like protein [Amycolatopsis decaplanina DSM 44594]